MLLGRLGRAATERPLWLALLFGAVLVSLAYQASRPVIIDIGGSLDAPHVQGFYEPETNGTATFRWTDGAQAVSRLNIPGLGMPFGGVSFTLQMSAGPRPGNEPVFVSVRVNGHNLEPAPVTGESRPFTFDVPHGAIGADGNIVIELSAPPFLAPGDKRPLGVLIDFVQIAPSAPTLPSTTQMLWLILSGFFVYVAMRAVNLTRQAAACAVALIFAGSAALIVVQRMLLTIFTGRIAFTLFLALVVALLTEWLVRWLAYAAGWRGARRLPEAAFTVLRATIMLAVLLKVGGLLYPDTYIIDAPFHLKYITYMAEGRSLDEYFGESLALAVMPKEEWGSARAFIPYSPFFYFVAAPLASLPVPISLSVPTFMAMLEAIKIAPVFLFALALSAVGRRNPGGRPESSGRLAAATAAVYSFIPATFLLQQWGNWPTQLSLWLVTVWAAITALFWRKLNTPLIWIVVTVLLTLTLLSYTVTAFYTGFLVAIFVLGGWVFAQQERKKWGLLAGSALTAFILSIVIYYGQYVGRVLGDTLPTFTTAVREQGKLTTLRPSGWEFISGYVPRVMHSYSLGFIYTLALSGTLLLVLARRRQADLTTGPLGSYTYSFVWHPRLPREIGAARIWLLGWLLTFPVFMLADFYVDQAFKEFWFALPAVSLVAAAWLIAYFRKLHTSRSGSVFFVLLSVLLIWQGFSLWVFRLFFHNR